MGGTDANANIGPDLTHLWSRGYLAAGTLPMNVGDLTGWITDPQPIKPGTQMPATTLSPADLAALVAYLQSLK